MDRNESRIKQLKMALEKETDPERRASLEAELQRRIRNAPPRRPAGAVVNIDSWR